MYSCITSICRLLGALLVILTAYAAPAGAQLTTSGFPLTTLTGQETVDCQPPPTNPPTSPWVTTCTSKQISQVITGLPNTWTQPQTINTTGLTTIYGPGTPLFVWANPSTNAAGVNTGCRFWTGSGSGGMSSTTGQINAFGTEGNQFRLRIGNSGQDWQVRLNGSGVFYVWDQSTGRAPLQFLPGHGGAVSVVDAVFGIPQVTWVDNETCVAGQISVDSSFVYVCTATNTVKRAALSTF
jgi:hypothetical protein